MHNLKTENITDENLLLRLFPFSLKDKAKHWLQSLEANSIHTWEVQQTTFLNKNFPIIKTNQIRKDIRAFAMNDGESLYESWERFKDLLRSCPHHQVPKWQLVQTFYEGLTFQHQNTVDAICAGTFLQKSADNAWKIFETLSENSLHQTP